MSIIKATDVTLKDGDILIDIRWDMQDAAFGKAEYDKGHIKGAVFVDAEDFLTDEISEHGGRHPLPDMDEFRKKLEAIGVSSRSDLYVYDTGNLNACARFWIMLRMIGIEAKVIENGFSALKEAGFEVTKEVPTVKNGSIDVVYNADINVDKDYVNQSMDNEKSVLIDSRSPERHRGEEEPFDRLAGTIPSSVNYFWKDNYNEDESIKSKDFLENRFKDLKGYDEIIVYCGSGITGANNLMIMDSIGIKAKMYLGSFSDYISYDDNYIISKGEKVSCKK